MRSPPRLVPTESFWLSIGLGVLIPCLVVLAGVAFAGYFFILVVLLSFFVCGFSASIVFGTDSPGGLGYNVLAGIAAGIVFFIGMFSLTIGWALGEGISVRVSQPIYAFFLLLPFSAIGCCFLLVTGSMSGWVVAQAVER